MAYVTNALSQVVSTIEGSGPSIWTYFSSDSLATIQGAAYVSDAGKKNIRLGDLVFVSTGTLNTALSTSPTTTAEGEAPSLSAVSNTVILQVASVSGSGDARTATLGPVGIDIGTAVVNAGTSTSAAGAVTLNATAGTITTETITTTGQTVYTLTITNSSITATDLVFVSLQNGSNTTGLPTVNQVTPGAGTLTIKVANAATTATNPFGGSLKISFLAVKAS